MNASRILILSNAQPLRSWKISSRITQEITGAKICGVIQLPVQEPSTADCGPDGSTPASGRSKVRRWFYSRLAELIHGALWFAHGCPRSLNNRKKFTTNDLARRCSQAGWPLLEAGNIAEARVREFIRQQAVELVVVVGDIALNPELLEIPSCGAIRAFSQQAGGNASKAEPALQIKIEHFVKGSRVASPVASIIVPFQPYDRLPGYTLKTNLIADDLLVSAAASLQTVSPAQLSKIVTQGLQETLLPYLTTIEHTPLQPAPAAPAKRFRTPWKLYAETLLFAPRVLARNWYRRLRNRYPVLILGHHLVSDRPHRMGIPTEDFWQVIRFLQRHYRIVSFSEGVELLRSGKITAPTIVLTFDDGYVENFVNLRAVADDAQIPVTLFIATQPVEMRREFQHDLAHGIRGALPLTWEQMLYWSLRGAEFGSHTRTHCDCGSTDAARLEWELMGSRSDLESHLGRTVRSFAFPFGKQKNISPDAARIAASVYSYFVSCFGGENLPGGTGNDHTHLFRKNLYPDLWELELELQSVFDWVEKLKRNRSHERSEPAPSPGRASVASAFE